MNITPEQLREIAERLIDQGVIPFIPANHLATIFAEFQKLQDSREANIECAAHRLALELECLLLDTKDMAVVSRWWDSGHEALSAWHALDDQPHISPLGMD